MADTAARVLIVDDERFFRDAIGEVLEEAGISSRAVDGGEAALAAVEDERLAAVVLDLQLPGMSGLEVLEGLRARRPDLRVLILSASADQEEVLDALRAGASDYLAKPLHDEELVLAVSRALEGHALATDWQRSQDALARLVEALDGLAADAGALQGEEREQRLQAAAVEAAAEVLRARKTSLLWLDERGELLEVVAAVGRSLAPEEMDAVPLGAGLAGAVASKGEALLVADLAADPRFGADADREAARGRYDTGSCALAPVAAGGRPLGVLCAADRDDARPFGVHDLALLRLLAQRLAEALAAPPAPEAAVVSGGDPGETVELLEPRAAEADPLAERDAELARRICDAMVSEVEPERVLRAVLEPIPQLLGGAASLYLLDGATGALECEASVEAGEGGDRPRLATDRGLTGLVVQTGQMIATGRPERDARFDPAVDTPAEGGVRPLLCVPLALRGKCVGVCRVFPPADAPGDPSARTGEVLAAALSAAVRNVLLYRSLIESIEEVAEVRRQSRR